VGMDESAFYLLPAVVPTYPRRGQPPVLRTLHSRDHLAVISATTPDRRLVVHKQGPALCGTDVMTFLRQVLRCIPGKLLELGVGRASTITRRCGSS
jgi:hypothetical protein